MNVVKSICNVVQITALCILVIVVVAEPNSSLFDMPNTHSYIICFVLSFSPLISGTKTTTSLVIYLVFPPPSPP